MVRAIRGVQFKGRKRSTDLMFVLHLSETLDQLAIASCSLVWSCVEERGWSCLEKVILFCGLISREEREGEEDMEKAD